MTHGVQASRGRPRSQRARTAVLHAVDDLLSEVGYANMTMKLIAERAGVGRETVYRWWPTKAHILVEACVEDAREELDRPPATEPFDAVRGYLYALVAFLRSDAGLAYRALVGEAQHDPQVAALLSDNDVLAYSASQVVERAFGHRPDPEMIAELIGPVFYLMLIGQDPTETHLDALASSFAITRARTPHDVSS